MKKSDDRTPERLRLHYEVERELAARIRESTRAERTALYGRLYGELFERVPDHPRLTRRESPEKLARAIAARMKLARPLLTPETEFLEFAPGDCRFAWEVAKQVRHVHGIDISDQSGDAEPPENFTLHTYDGYEQPMPDNSVDVAFSYQLLEHFHPEDVPLHFQMVSRLLRPGGAYIIDTPHRFTGPHDVSRHFSDVPQGFHMQEWTNGELAKLALANGFSRWQPIKFGKPQGLLFKLTLRLAEVILEPLPHRWRRRTFSRGLQSVAVIVYN